MTKRRDKGEGSVYRRGNGRYIGEYNDANGKRRYVSGTLQDFAYAYDLAGNVLRIVDLTPGCGVQANPDAQRFKDTDPDLVQLIPGLAQLLAEGDALIRRFGYDPLYRLRSATGHECSSIPRPRPWPDDPRYGFNSHNHGTPNQDNAPNLTANYHEELDYDPAGNVVRLTHCGKDTPWVRRFGVGGLRPQQWEQEWRKHLNTTGEWINPPGNKLTHVRGKAVDQTHVYDARGNLAREGPSKHFEWDHSDRMRVYRTQVGNSEATKHAHYLYDANGQRVKKLVRDQGGACEVTVYVEGLFEHHLLLKRRNGVYEVEQQNNLLHILDNQDRIALTRVGNPFPNDTAPSLKYHLRDHLGSSNLVIEHTGSWTNREEYTPFGETSFGGFAKKRYRFTGKERDEESGLYYHGARYYAPWLARWVSCDPADKADVVNLYTAYSNNPVKYVDPTGGVSDPAPLSVESLAIRGEGTLTCHDYPMPGWGEGLGTATHGAALIGFAVWALGSGGASTGVLVPLAIALSLSAGTVALGVGLIALGLYATGALTSEQATAVSDVGMLPDKFAGNPYKFAGTLIGGAATQSLEGMNVGAEVGNVLNLTLGLKRLGKSSPASVGKWSYSTARLLGESGTEESSQVTGTTESSGKAGDKGSAGEKDATKKYKDTSGGGGGVHYVPLRDWSDPDRSKTLPSRIAMSATLFSYLVKREPWEPLPPKDLLEARGGASASGGGLLGGHYYSGCGR